MRAHPVFRLGLLAALIIGGVLVARMTPLGAHLHEWARQLGAEAERPWAPFAYVALYAGAIAVALPGTILTIIGGVAFGPVLGYALNLAGALLGATLAFFEARYLARDAARSLFGKHLARLPDLSSPRRALVAFFQLRMLPLLPFNGVNFAAGLTETRYLPFLAGTAIGIMPSTAAYTYFSAELVRGGKSAEGAAWHVGVLLVLFGIVALAPTLWQLARRRVKSVHGANGSGQPGGGPLSGASGADLPSTRSA